MPILIVFYLLSLEYKTNFLKLQKLVLIGGPDDGVITPWQSRYDAHHIVIVFIT